MSKNTAFGQTGIDIMMPVCVNCEEVVDLSNSKCCTKCFYPRRIWITNSEFQRMIPGTARLIVGRVKGELFFAVTPLTLKCKIPGE